MTSPSGDQLTQFRVGDGSLLGLPGLIGNRPYTLTATALAGAELRFINRAEFTLVMQSDPQLALKILEVLAAEVCAARRALSDI
jgi:CRP-like cAMP-binding protein